MLILTQDGHHILNLKDIEDIYLSYIEKENVIYCCINGDDEIEMGEYKDKERCKEVLKEILEKYESLKECKFDLKYYSNLNCKPMRYVSHVFYMPEE